MSIQLSSFKWTESISGHSSFVYCLLLLQDGRLASCSDDETIIVYNKSNYDVDISIEGHEGTVWYITQLSNSDIISCSIDCTIKIWKITERTYKCKETLRGHNKSVSKVITISHNRIASSSDDKTIKIWDIEQSNSKCIATLYGHSDCISSILKITNHNMLISGDYKPGHLLFWNLEQMSIEKKIEDVSCWGPNSMIEYNLTKILIGGLSIIYLVNFKTTQIESIISDSSLHKIYCFFILQDGSFLTGGYRIIRQFNGKTLKCIAQKKEIHADFVVSLCRESNECFYTSSFEDEIKKWVYCQP